MRALTVLQPWASAIALNDPRMLGPDGGKGVENRDWAPWSSIVGKYLAIHAGKAPAEAGEVMEVGRMLYGSDQGEEVWRAWSGSVAAHAGMIVAVAKVIGWVTRREELPAAQRRWKIDGSKGWVLEDVRALASPILCRGAQGIWSVPPDVARQVAAQVRR